MSYSCGALVVESARLLLPSLREATKLVGGVLYIPLADGLYNDDSQVMTSSPESRDPSTLAAHTIRQAFLHVAETCPSLDLRFILPPPPPLISSTYSLPTLHHRVGVVMSHMTSFSALGEIPSYRLLRQRVSATSEDLSNMFQHLSTVDSSSPPPPPPPPPLLRTYDHVALGGTFDHMHTGHRLLLTESLLLSRKRLLVGVASGQLLKSKVLPELIASEEERVGNVRGFLEDVKCGIQHDVVTITDVYGPTAWDADLQCLVVTPDTARGGSKVNEERQRKGLPPLEIHMATLVGSKVGSGGVVSEEEKLSSSDVRQSLLGQPQTPLVDECLEYDPHSEGGGGEGGGGGGGGGGGEGGGEGGGGGGRGGPFLIGLTGAMASGKSTLLRRLVEKGAFPIDCDQLGHETYSVGGPVYERIIEEFGEGVRGEGGEIDRRALGAIVFSDKEKMSRLNDIVWPEIWKLVEVKVHEAGRQGYRVCVVDAAVLLMAGWHRRVHQVWTTLAPHDELVKRVMKRNRISEEAAIRRLESQPPNQMYVDHAHIVIGTQWEPEVTKGQVEKAWLHVLERIKNC